MKNNSQINDVINHLKTNGAITSLDAFKYYGITRLSAIIYILRNDYDMQIETENIRHKNRYGNTTNYAKYHLVNF